jgi:N-acetylglucosaminyldiphosphoundecaprenol N-acetyl-beta-D-mannosaminyltransferase
MVPHNAGGSEEVVYARPVQRVRIGPIWMDALTFPGVLKRIEELVAAGRGGAIFTPNVDHIVKADRSRALREAYQTADLSLPDGQWVLWASRLLGTPLSEKISGSDLALPLARLAAAKGWSMYLLGGADGVAEAAAARLERETGVRICGFESPFIDLASPDPAVAERVRAARPTLVLVALGAPKQELWIQRNLETLRPAVMLAVGGTLDFVAGRLRRAPRWMSRSGLEWLFRLALEPRRLARRYLIDDPHFLAIVARTLREPRSARRQG